MPYDDVINEMMRAAERVVPPAPPRARRVRTANGSLVLCPAHVDMLREVYELTSETFDLSLCDRCEDEMERGRR